MNEREISSRTKVQRVGRGLHVHIYWRLMGKEGLPSVSVCVSNFHYTYYLKHTRVP